MREIKPIPNPKRPTFFDTMKDNDEIDIKCKVCGQVNRFNVSVDGQTYQCDNCLVTLGIVSNGVFRSFTNPLKETPAPIDTEEMPKQLQEIHSNNDDLPSFVADASPGALPADYTTPNELAIAPEEPVEAVVEERSVEEEKKTLDKLKTRGNKNGNKGITI